MAHDTPPPAPGADDATARFERWIHEHLPALYRVAYRLLGDGHNAEDVLQDTLRSAWASRELYEPSRSERAWLLGILRRRAADHWRRHGRTPPTLIADAATVAAPPAPQPLADELSSRMQLALATLTPELRETLLLVVVGELTHQEAADLLGVPLGTVLSRVSRARVRLRECLVGRVAGDASSGGA